MMTTKDLYLDLLKKSLTNLNYAPDFLDLYDENRPNQINLVQPRPEDLQLRIEGHDWPGLACTMIGLKRLDNLQSCVEEVLANNVPGNLIEAEVWRGGAAIFMRALLKAHAVNDRIVWVADSFEGLPPPSPDKYPADAGNQQHALPYLRVPLEQVRSNFARYNLLDDQVRFAKGWFRNTFPALSDQRWAVIRLDGDMYESTMDGLVNLYPNLSVGGYMIIDDYGCYEACRQAVHDYRDAHGIREEILSIDWTGVFWKREEAQARYT